jgi:hypothetical protein
MPPTLEPTITSNPSEARSEALGCRARNSTATIKPTRHTPKPGAACNRSPRRYGSILPLMLLNDPLKQESERRAGAPIYNEANLFQASTPSFALQRTLRHPWLVHPPRASLHGRPAGPTRLLISSERHPASATIARIVRCDAHKKQPVSFHRRRNCSLKYKRSGTPTLNIGGKANKMRAAPGYRARDRWSYGNEN